MTDPYLIGVASVVLLVSVPVVVFELDWEVRRLLRLRRLRRRGGMLP